ncbi:dephospho-CoA kinase, partial [bacterium I07]
MIVGVTGGVGSGKSEFCAALAAEGAAVIDADLVGRKIVRNNKTVKKLIRNRFGKQMFDCFGRLRRRRLGRLVFSDPDQLSALNQIIQPFLVRKIREQIQLLLHSDPDRLIVLDMAILFESGMLTDIDKVLVITAPEKNRIHWLKASRGWTEKEILDRIGSQIPTEEKIKMADLIIENSGSLEALAEKAPRFYRQYNKTQSN